MVDRIQPMKCFSCDDVYYFKIVFNLIFLKIVFIADAGLIFKAIDAMAHI